MVEVVKHKQHIISNFKVFIMSVVLDFIGPISINIKENGSVVINMYYRIYKSRLKLPERYSEGVQLCFFLKAL